MHSGSALKVKPVSLQVIENPLALLSQTEPVQEDVITLLLNSVVHASAETARQIETVLLRMGRRIVPVLLENLSHEEIAVQSCAAMVLIRMGHTVGPALQAYYEVSEPRDAVDWVFGFIADQLVLQLPTRSAQAATSHTMAKQPELLIAG